MAAGTVRRQGGRSYDGIVRNMDGRFYIPLHTEDTVYMGGTLEVADEARGQTGDEEGRLYY